MRPLFDWTARRGYTFGVPTFYNNFHIGLDLIVPTGTKVVATQDGVAVKSVGPQGGNTITLGSTRFLHLSKFLKTGEVKKGDIIAETGNTGASTSPHLHIDVKVNGNYVDPETYFMPQAIPVTIIGADVPGLKQEVEKWSKGFFTVDVKNVPMDIPYNPVTDYSKYVVGQSRYCIVSCKPGPEIYKTTMTNDLNQAYAIGGTSALTCAYELSHMIHKYYLVHRNKPTDPYIDIEDTLNPADEQRYRKYDVMKPYTGIILRPEPLKPMFELRQVPSSREVWLVRNGLKTHLFNQGALMAISDFASIKPITSDELDKIPDSGLELATLVKE